MSSFAQLTYTGGLHIECEHLQSGTKIMTHSSDKSDAVLESFSPVDLCAVSMAACACPMMGLFAENHNLDITGIRLQVDMRQMPLGGMSMPVANKFVKKLTERERREPLLTPR